MAYDGASSWWGFLGQKINKAFYQLTTKAGDIYAGGAQDSGNTAAGIAYARVVVLSDGVADHGPLGAAANPLSFTAGAPYHAVDKGYAQATFNTATAAVAPGVAAAIAAGATWAVFVCETQNMRYRGDGTNPTAGVGNPLLIGEQLVWSATNLGALEFIEQVAGAVLNVNYFA